MSIGAEITASEKYMVVDNYKMEAKKALPFTNMVAKIPKLDDMRRIIENKKKEMGFTGVFKPKEAGVISHDLPVTVMAELEAADQLMVDEGDTDYTLSPLLLADVSDLCLLYTSPSPRDS